jgi:hypothetical protein
MASPTPTQFGPCPPPDEAAAFVVLKVCAGDAESSAADSWLPPFGSVLATVQAVKSRVTAIERQVLFMAFLGQKAPTIDVSRVRRSDPSKV